MCIGVEFWGEVRHTFDTIAAAYETGLALFDKSHMRACCADARLGVDAAETWLVFG